MPQYKKNLLLKQKLAAMESDLEETLSHAKLQSDYNVKRYGEYIEGLEMLKDYERGIRDQKEDVVEAYVNRVALKNDEVTRLKLEFKLKEQNFTAYWPDWMKYLNKVKEVRKEHGYSNKTRWRSVVQQLLQQASRAFAKRNGEEQTVCGDFRRMCISFNSFGTFELNDQLQHLEDIAGDIEGSRNPTFHLLRLEYRVSRNAYEKCRDIPAYRDGMVVEMEGRKAEMREQAKEHLKKLGLDHTVLSKTSDKFDHRKAVSLEVQEKVKDELRLALRVPVTRDNKDKIEGMYNNLLAYCGNCGDWVGAIKAYEEFVKRGFVPNRYVFNCIVTACKKANPVQSDRAVLILDWMLENDVPPTAGTYNSVIDCCRVGGSWRRGVQVFELMMRQDIKPNTNTYAIMAKLGFGAGEDAGEVYSVLKFAGVPEYIAYTSAASNALRGFGKGRQAKPSMTSSPLTESLKSLSFVTIPVDRPVLTQAEIMAGKKLKQREAAREMGKAVEALLAPKVEDETSEWDNESLTTLSNRGNVAFQEAKNGGSRGLGVYKGKV